MTIPGFKRIISEFDETVFGIQKNQLDQLRYYFTHSHKFYVLREALDVDLSYEIDHKQSKFISKENSLILRAGREGSKWKVKFEGTQRKNLIDPYSSREYLKNEIMLNYKQSVGL